MLLQIKLALVNAALAATGALMLVLDLLLSRALPIFAFLNTVAFALVCLSNVVNGAGINPYYAPVPLTIFWYGFGFSLASFIALALAVTAGIKVVACLHQWRYSVQAKIAKLLADAEAAELQARQKKDAIQKLLLSYHWVYNAMRAHGDAAMPTFTKSKIYREALERNAKINGCLDCQHMHYEGQYRIGDDYCVPEWHCTHPDNMKENKEQFSFQAKNVIVAIPQWTDNPNCPRHKNSHGEEK